LKRIVVVGAGAAGIIAAWKAAHSGAKVTLLEKKERIGFKILISGGGKCNITHDGDIPKLLGCFRRNEANFLRPAFHAFTNKDICGLIESLGVELIVREDGRVFPLSSSAKGVTAALESLLADVGVELRTLAAVSEIHRLEGEGWMVSVSPPKSADPSGNPPLRIVADAVILCTGGLSYPGTGSTGDGWKWLAEMGHSIVKPRAALAPIFLDVVPPRGWAGVALRNVVLKSRQNSKEIARSRGDMLFTHRGVSGPAVLDISRVVAEMRQFGPIELFADLAPDNGYEKLKELTMEWIRQHPKRSLNDYVANFAPARVAGDILEKSDIAGKCGAQITREQRNRLIERIKEYRIGTVQHVPLEKGEVTAGGVNLDEVNPRTMESRLLPGLYICGEILDIAGPVGGYNLQAAFSTGYVAGLSAALAD
jgi:predicted Rossmann fold flavoprotein